MIPVVSTTQMREIDRRAINGNIITGYSYMLKAGMGLFDVINDLNLKRESDEIAIVCGKGNNGGDGYVVGGMLFDKGYQVMCFGLCEGSDLSGEARIAYEEYVGKDGSFFHINDAADLEGFSRYSIIIDALLGTGTRGDPRGIYAEIIRLINSSNKIVISVDTPSGLDNDTGQPSSPAISAHHTVTMGFPKIGQFFYPGRKLIGQLCIKNLGYPIEIVEQETMGVFLPTLTDCQQWVPQRHAEGSKFDHGQVLIIGGSRGMTGSAALSANAALRSGCGMVHCAIPESILPVLATKVTETVLHVIAETTAATPSLKSAETIIRLAQNMQAVLIGPGISHHQETVKLVRQIVSELSLPVVLDADGINAYKGKTEDLKDHKQELIITPHVKEWERLFGVLPSNPLDKIHCLGKKAQEYSMTIVFKGNPTLIVNHKGKAYILPVGNSGMATAGSGDVLSGIITALIAQGCVVQEAALVGVAIHGLAGEEVSAEKGEYSVIASDIINNISGVFNRLNPVNTAGILPK